MKYIFTLQFALIATLSFSQNTAPSDYTVKTVNLDSKSENYIDLSSSSVSTNTNLKWDIAFYNEVHEIGGKINEQAGVRVWRVYKDTTHFSSVTIADTSNEVFNSDSFANLGGMDSMYSGSLNTFFQIGLGKYYGTHEAYGDRIYIIKKENGGFGKFYLSSYKPSGRVFTIHYADIDNGSDVYISIPKIVPLAKHFRYVNLSTQIIDDNIEPLAYNNWDIKISPNTYFEGGIRKTFSNYITTNNAYNLVRFSIPDQLPPSLYTAPIVRTEAYMASGSPSTVTYNNSLNTGEAVSMLNNQIGVSWYDFNNSNTKQNVSYFLKDNDNNIFHLIFTNYNGLSVNIAYKKVGNYASIGNINNEKHFTIGQSNHELLIESINNEPVTLSIYNIESRLVKKINFSKKVTIPMANYEKGMLFVLLETNNHLESFKVMVP